MFSLNARGVGGAYKILVLKRLFNVYKLDLIMIQKIMCLGHKVVDILSLFLII